MIYSLNGKLIYSDPQTAVVECGGVGYKCTISQRTYSQLSSVGDTVFLYTYMVVREDAVELYGFFDDHELQFFKMVTSVSGVGAKTGIAILSTFSPAELSVIIAGSDFKKLSTVSGLGPKGSQRIILELKDKIGSAGFSSSEDIGILGNAGKTTNASDAVDALIALGFTQSEAALAVGRADPELPVEEIIKQALKALSK